MDDPSNAVNIELEDLQELARINPLAWEQILHIADNRRNAERIKDLEAHLDQAHKYGETRKQVSNGVVAVTNDAG
jgi:hypothetical protein